MFPFSYMAAASIFQYVVFVRRVSQWHTMRTGNQRLHYQQRNLVRAAAGVELRQPMP